MKSGWIRIGDTVHFFVSRGTWTRKFLEARCLSVPRLPGEDDALYNRPEDLRVVSVCRSCKQKVTAAQMAMLVDSSSSSREDSLIVDAASVSLPIIPSTADDTTPAPDAESVSGHGGEFSGGGASGDWSGGDSTDSSGGGDSGGGSD